MRICRRGLHEIPDGKRECVVCKKKRDDVHRHNHWLAGKKAHRDRESYRRRYWSDPLFRERERERGRAGCEARREARNLGVTIDAYRDMMQ